MIQSYRDRDTEAVDKRRTVKKFSTELQRRAQRKLTLLDGAKNLSDLRLPPGNQLEKLAGDRSDQHSIRINRQWRICFVWHDGDAYDVEIVDYH